MRGTHKLQDQNLRLEVNELDQIYKYDKLFYYGHLKLNQSFTSTTNIN